jgi:signal transduction histidine kinase
MTRPSTRLARFWLPALAGLGASLVFGLVSQFTSERGDLLLGAALLGVAAAVIVRQLQRSRRQGERLAATNGALETRMQEARDAEASLRKLSEELEGRVRSRTRLLENTMSDLEALNFSVSHDLRSPIGAVLNFVMILEEEHRLQLDPSGREILARIRASAERAIELLEALLRLSRAGRAELTLEPLDMTALAREAFSQAHGAADGEVEFVLRPLPLARGDRALIGTVFVNLLSNALKYTRGREKRHIELTGSAGDDGSVYAISDNGVGFDARFASKLFGAFERLHPPGQFEGAGIGLAVVARIVLRHGGRVWAEGSPEQGATFFFSLPTDSRGGW